jgi:hypothetical protein
MTKKTHLHQMKPTIEDKINAINKLAESSKGYVSSKPKKMVANTEDSLYKVITNKKDADIFLAELDAAFKLAQKNKASSK